MTIVAKGTAARLRPRRAPRTTLRVGRFVCKPANLRLERGDVAGAQAEAASVRARVGSARHHLALFPGTFPGLDCSDRLVGRLHEAE